MNYEKYQSETRKYSNDVFLNLERLHEVFKGSFEIIDECYNVMVNIVTECAHLER